MACNCYSINENIDNLGNKGINFPFPRSLNICYQWLGYTFYNSVSLPFGWFFFFPQEVSLSGKYISGSPSASVCLNLNSTHNRQNWDIGYIKLKRLLNYFKRFFPVNSCADCVHNKGLWPRGLKSSPECTVILEEKMTF